MTDVRALLAAERQSRRISHPHLSYAKSGVLLCNVCNLNVKSEALWDGHLKSANHRKNVAAQASRQASGDAGAGKGVKRKIEDVDKVSEERDDADTDARKKPKSRPESTVVEGEAEELAGPVLPKGEAQGPAAEPTPPPLTADDTVPVTEPSAAAPTVDEDEWAAFEREVAPLAAEKPDYSSATITAAPVTADQAKAQDEEDRRRRLETEAEDEREEEVGRLAEEFDVMEEMEERVRKLREKRDALRTAAPSGNDTGQDLGKTETERLPQSQATNGQNGALEDSDEDEDGDDWYS
jgi:zinc finger protein 830